MARRGVVLELAVLGLLADAPMHGYELRKRLNALLGVGRLLSYGTLYPHLKTLGRLGYLTAVESGQREVSRRTKIVYQLTDSGREHLETLLDEAGPNAWDDESFGVHLAFFSKTAVTNRVRILEGRRARLEERLANSKASSARGRAAADHYRSELQRHSLETLERDISWLTQLIDSERAGLANTGSPAELTVTAETAEVSDLSADSAGTDTPGNESAVLDPGAPVDGTDSGSGTDTTFSLHTTNEHQLPTTTKK